MNVKKFTAATSRDALRKVREALGPDAVILSNRPVDGVVEILALANDEVSPAAQSVPAPMPEPEPEPEARVSLSMASFQQRLQQEQQQQEQQRQPTLQQMAQMQFAADQERQARQFAAPSAPESYANRRAAVIMWIVCAIAWQACMMFMYKCELNNSKAEIQLLADLNRALNLETRELADQAHMDLLTGVLNRQGLRALLLNSSTFLTPPMAIVFLDIDHFKKVNDLNGHQVGDLVLKQFASTVVAAIRSSDKLIRWGGEEFLLLCPATDLLQAAALAEKLRIRIASSSWPNDLRITASFGVAQHQAGDDIGQVIERADAELYAAKSAGRNRVSYPGC